MRNWPDPQKPTKTVKEEREGGKDAEELSLPMIPCEDLWTEHQTQQENQLEEKNEIYQSPGPGFRFGQGPKCRGYEGKQYNRHKKDRTTQI